MIFKSSCFAILSVTIFIFSGCSSENKQISQTYHKIPQTETLAVPQVEVFETAKFKELKRQFEAVENEVNQTDDLRNQLRTLYTDRISKGKKNFPGSCQSQGEIKNYRRIIKLRTWKT